MIDQCNLTKRWFIHRPDFQEVIVSPLCLLDVYPGIHLDVAVTSYVDRIHHNEKKAVCVLHHIVLLAVRCCASLAIHRCGTVTNYTDLVSVTEADPTGSCSRVIGQKAQLTLTAGAPRVANGVGAGVFDQRMIGTCVLSVKIVRYWSTVNGRAFLKARVADDHIGLA